MQSPCFVLVFTVSACWTFFFVCLLLFWTSSRICDACILAWIPLLNARSTKIQRKQQTNDDSDCFLCQLRLGLSFTLSSFANGVSPTSSLVYATVRSSTQFFPLCNLFPLYLIFILSLKFIFECVTSVQLIICPWNARERRKWCKCKNISIKLGLLLLITFFCVIFAMYTL